LNKLNYYYCFRKYHGIFGLAKKRKKEDREKINEESFGFLSSLA